MMVRVYDLGHSRAGDKGNTSNFSVVTYNEDAWRTLHRYLTAQRVLAAYAHLGAGPVTRSSSSCSGRSTSSSRTRWAAASPDPWRRTCTARASAP